MTRHLARWGTAGLVVALGCALASAAPSQGSVAAAATPRDGRIAVYDANSDRIDTLNPDGSARFPVTADGESSFDPAWAPNGSRLAFASNHAGDDIRIFTVKPDGSDLRQVTHDDPGYNDFTPAYTADGSRIIFSRCRPDPPGGCPLASVRPDGTGLRALTTIPDGDVVDFWPDVSPDGKQISFTRFGYHGIQVQTWVMRADGTGAHPITTPSFEGGTAKWIDDHHLAVTNQFAHFGLNVYRMRDDGSGLTKLTNAKFPHNALDSSPSPSGAHIVYVDDTAYPELIGGDLIVMRPDGTGKHAITANGRTLENDWGTAPLVDPKTVTTQSDAAPRLQSRRALSPAVTAVLALTRGGRVGGTFHR
jgi:Tol biopolymer transport system component